jgi:hypothetical protein
MKDLIFEVLKKSLYSQTCPAFNGQSYAASLFLALCSTFPIKTDVCLIWTLISGNTAISDRKTDLTIILNIVAEKYHCTHHSTFVGFKELHDLFSLFVPQEHVTTVTATHYVLTLWTIEVDPLHCNVFNTTISA